MIDTQEEQLPPKKRMSDVEFVRICEGYLKANPLYSQYYDGIGVTFQGITIDTDIHIENAELLDIILIDVSLPKLIINHCESGNITFENSTVKSFRLSNHKTDNVSISITTTNIQHFAIESSKLMHLSFSDAYSQSIHLSQIIINGLSVFGGVTGEISCYGTKMNQFTIEQSITHGIFLVKTNIQSQFLINSNAITGNINILENSTIEKIWFYGLVISPYIHFKNSTIPHVLFSEGTIIGELLIDNLNVGCKKLHIDCSEIGRLTIDTDNPYKIVINGKPKLRSSIHYLNLKKTVTPPGFYLNISDTDINEIDFTSFVNSGHIVFSNVRPLHSFKKFTIGEFGKAIREDGKYIFETIEYSSSSIEITNSDLGNTQFISCDLDLFDDFEFESSKILDIFIADTGLPTHNDINKDFPDDYEQRRLALGQFKRIYERQGDVVRATQYRAEEMEVYRAQLKDNESKFPSRDWWNNKAERANLWLNKFSNFYGNNWLKAVGWTLLFNSILYTFYCWAQGYWFGNNWDTFWMLSAHSFEFLNPLRKADFLEHITGEHPRAGAIAIDYVSRIIIAYFVYQTITAFRKFGKSSV